MKLYFNFMLLLSLCFIETIPSISVAQDKIKVTPFCAVSEDMDTLRIRTVFIMDIKYKKQDNKINRINHKEKYVYDITCTPSSGDCKAIILQLDPLEKGELGTMYSPDIFSLDFQNNGVYVFSAGMFGQITADLNVGTIYYKEAWPDLIGGELLSKGTIDKGPWITSKKK